MASPDNNLPPWGSYIDLFARRELDGPAYGKSCITWSEGETGKILAGVQPADKNSIVRLWDKRPGNVKEHIATPSNPQTAQPIPTPHRPLLELGLDGAQDEDGGNNHSENQNSGDGSQQVVNSEIDNLFAVARPINNNWTINGAGHLEVSQSFANVLATKNLAPWAPTTIAQKDLELKESEDVINLAVAGHHLAAFRRALRSAAAAVIPHTAVGTAVLLRDRYPYPVIGFLMTEWRPDDVEVQRYMAYYLVREMMRRYRHVPFPDRVDFWEYSIGQYRGNDRLLLPYGQIADGDQRNTRWAIVNELMFEGPVDASQRLVDDLLGPSRELEMVFDDWDAPASPSAAPSEYPSP